MCSPAAVAGHASTGGTRDVAWRLAAGLPDVRATRGHEREGGAGPLSTGGGRMAGR